MNVRSLLSAAMLGAVCAGAVPVLYADEPAAPGGSVAAWPKGHYATLDALPDWGGIWTYVRPPRDAPRERPLLKGEYLAGYEAWRREVEANDGMVAREGSYCRPPGMPGIMSVGQYPIEFLFTPGRVTTHHEAWNVWRNIYTDGRGHPDDWEGSFHGHSIGRWEGDTLVVETVGIKESVPLGMGMSHSGEMRIQERIHLAKDDPDTLVVEMTITDPQALQKPWTSTLTYSRMRDADLIEFICTENDRNPVDEHGNVGFE